MSYPYSIASRDLAAERIEAKKEAVKVFRAKAYAQSAAIMQRALKAAEAGDLVWAQRLMDTAALVYPSPLPVKNWS